MEKIRDIKKLSERLGSSFVLFIGSAVSGKNSPEVSMGLTVMEAILEQISILLSKDTSKDNYNKPA